MANPILGANLVNGLTGLQQGDSVFGHPPNVRTIVNEALGHCVVQVIGHNPIKVDQMDGTAVVSIDPAALTGGGSGGSGGGGTFAPESVLVYVQSAITSMGGAYVGIAYAMNMNVNQLAEPLETLPELATSTGVVVVILNADEDGQPTHWLTLGQYLVGTYTGQAFGQIGDEVLPPYSVVTVNNGTARTASATLIGAVGEILTPMTETWDRRIVTSGTNKGDVPVRVYYHRTAYDSAAVTPQLIGFVWSQLYDASGKLVSISAETQYNIDTPTDCSIDGGTT